jgi:hypothetical protein
MTSGGDWLLLQEMLDRGDPEFVDRLREIADADALGTFAERWYTNPSPNARRLLLTYLERPLNAFRHEALVKRLFKHAEAAGDDAVMARFLVAFDRSIRRVIRKKYHHEHVVVENLAAAERQAAQWIAQGFDSASHFRAPMTLTGPYHVWGAWSDPYIITPGGTTMPRGTLVDYPVGLDWTSMRRLKTVQAPDWVGRLKLDPMKHGALALPPEASRKKLETFRLFSLATRQYLRRRAWRYFRKLGKLQPERYVPAISEALVLYEDADVDSGLAFIDNWGLVHALFHYSPVLQSHPRGWRVAEDRSLSELEPNPIYEHLWRSAPRALFDLMVRARSRPVRQWGLRVLRRDLAAASAAVSLEERIGLLGHVDPEVVAFAADWLRASPDLGTVSPERWLAVVESASPESLETLAEIMGQHVAAERVSLPDAARLAACRPLPLARLGLNWLKTKTPASDDERRSLFVLLEAQSEPLRPEILAWLRSTLASSPEFHSEWVLEFLDSRYADARTEGMSWFRGEPRAHDDVTLWQRLLESPYDDVRLALAADLDERLRLAKADGALELSHALDPDRLRLLWASVLLNVRRGGRVKPRVVEQVAQRLEHRPEEAEFLLPLLGVALRSLRQPERRAALTAVVRLVENRPETAPLVQKLLPELQWA